MPGLSQSPLNGSRTHPLKEPSIQVLRALRTFPIPYGEINAGVIDRLIREDLVEVTEVPNPYPSKKAKMVRAIKITIAGLLRLEEIGRDRGWSVVPKAETS